MKNIDPYIKLISLNKRIDQYERLKQITNILAFLCLFFIVGLSVYLFAWYNYYDYPDIDYSRLSHKMYAVDLIRDINSEYLFNVKKITFTEDLEDLAKGNSINANYYYLGKNRIFKRDIIIYLSGDYDEDIYVLQHEIIHSFCFNSNCEYICEDLGRKGVLLE
jgi:hypothetical protein